MFLCIKSNTICLEYLYLKHRHAVVELRLSKKMSFVDNFSEKRIEWYKQFSRFFMSGENAEERIKRGMVPFLI